MLFPVVADGTEPRLNQPHPGVPHLSVCATPGSFPVIELGRNLPAPQSLPTPPFTPWYVETSTKYWSSGAALPVPKTKWIRELDVGVPQCPAVMYASSLISQAVHPPLYLPMRTSDEGTRSSVSPQIDSPITSSLQRPTLTLDTSTLEVSTPPRTFPGEDSSTLTELPSKTAEKAFEERSLAVMTCVAVSPMIVSVAPAASSEPDRSSWIHGAWSIEMMVVAAFVSPEL
mmetsp:Transcript_21424/g.33635  ORF Transcript_21424/g.33635 Transcript_21424/m.33635 type:complete len:229 (-) Transcript_21424:224-910(-)